MSEFFTCLFQSFLRQLCSILKYVMGGHDFCPVYSNTTVDPQVSFQIPKDYPNTHETLLDILKSPVGSPQDSQDTSESLKDTTSSYSETRQDSLDMTKSPEDSHKSAMDSNDTIQRTSEVPPNSSQISKDSIDDSKSSLDNSKDSLEALKSEMDIPQKPTGVPKSSMDGNQDISKNSNEIPKNPNERHQDLMDIPQNSVDNTTNSMDVTKPSLNNSQDISNSSIDKILETFNYVNSLVDMPENFVENTTNSMDASETEEIHNSSMDTIQNNVLQTSSDSPQDIPIPSSVEKPDNSMDTSQESFDMHNSDIPQNSSDIPQASFDSPRILLNDPQDSFEVNQSSRNLTFLNVSESVLNVTQSPLNVSQSSMAIPHVPTFLASGVQDFLYDNQVTPYALIVPIIFGVLWILFITARSVVGKKSREKELLGMSHTCFDVDKLLYDNLLMSVMIAAQLGQCQGLLFKFKTEKESMFRRQTSETDKASLEETSFCATDTLESHGYADVSYSLTQQITSLEEFNRELSHKLVTLQTAYQKEKVCDIQAVIEREMQSFS